MHGTVPEHLTFRLLHIQQLPDVSQIDPLQGEAENIRVTNSPLRDAWCVDHVGRLHFLITLSYLTPTTRVAWPRGELTISQSTCLKMAAKLGATLSSRQIPARRHAP